MVELMHVVRLLHLHIVLRELVHNLCQVTVDSREDGHTYREIRGPEECLTLQASLANLITMLIHPPRRATDHLHALGPSLQIVTIGSLRSREFNSHISRCKLRAVEVLLVVDINDTHNFMTTAEGDLLDHLTHLSVAD